MRETAEFIIFIRKLAVCKLLTVFSLSRECKSIDCDTAGGSLIIDFLVQNARRGLDLTLRSLVTAQKDLALQVSGV